MNANVSTTTEVGWRDAAWRVGAPLIAFAIVCLVPLIALAADDDKPMPDARLEGYKDAVTLTEPSGLGGTIMFLIVLLGITFGVMFIHSKRSHLD